MKTICQMQLTDIDSVVKIHLSSFEGFFLSFLGEAFLKELYAGILAEPSGICFVVFLHSCQEVLQGDNNFRV